MINEWKDKTLIHATFLILITVFIDRFLWKMGDTWLMLIFTLIVVYVLWKASTQENFSTSKVFQDIDNRQWKVWEWTPTNWFGSIPNPDGGLFSDADWFVGIGGFRMPCSHYADGYTCRTYLRDNVWWYEACGHGNCWAGKITFIAIPRKYVEVYNWYQGW